MLRKTFSSLIGRFITGQKVIKSSTTTTDSQDNNLIMQGNEREPFEEGCRLWSNDYFSIPICDIVEVPKQQLVDLNFEFCY